MKRALWVVLAIAGAGAAFSAALLYRELAVDTASGCAPLVSDDAILGYPPCAFGLGMYAAILVAAIVGLHLGRQQSLREKRERD